jgi:hypothetical protein
MYYEEIPYSAADEKSYLEEHLSMLQNEMDSIKSRLDELVSEEKAKKK